MLDGKKLPRWRRFAAVAVVIWNNGAYQANRKFLHQYGGRVTPGFIGQPQSQGWTQVFRVPPNPLFLPKL